MRPQGRRDLERLLILKAWSDPEFRRKVVSDPKATLEQCLGRKLPEGMQIFVHEEDAKTIHFSVPLLPSESEVLPDEILEQVSGGLGAWAQVLSGFASGALSITPNVW